MSGEKLQLFVLHICVNHDAAGYIFFVIVVVIIDEFIIFFVTGNFCYRYCYRKSNRINILYCSFANKLTDRNSY